jgi:hypothetical protein
VPPRCSICNNRKRCQIDQCIIDGDSSRTIAKRFDVGFASVNRHIKAGHVSDFIKLNNQIKQQGQSLNVQKCAQEIYDLCFTTAQDIKFKDPRCVGSLLAPAVKVLEILNKGNDSSDKSGLDEMRESIRKSKDVETSSSKLQSV